MVLNKEFLVAIYEQEKLCMQVILTGLNNSRTFLICFENQLVINVRNHQNGK